MQNTGLYIFIIVNMVFDIVQFILLCKCLHTLLQLTGGFKIIIGIYPQQMDFCVKCHLQIFDKAYLLCRHFVEAAGQNNVLDLKVGAVALQGYTGTEDRRTTCSVTESAISSRKSFKPWVPMTTRSMPSFFTQCSIWSVRLPAFTTGITATSDFSIQPDRLVPAS